MNKSKQNFHPKRSTPRKVLSLGHNNMNAAERALEFGLSHGNAHMTINNNVLSFDPQTGIWFSDSKENANKNILDQPKKEPNSNHLEKENQMLLIKNELLLDMLAEVYSEFKLQN